MLAWLKMLRSHPPTTQVRILCWLGLAMLALAMIPLLLWRSPPSPATAPGITVLGKVTSGPNEWKSDRSMVAFSVKYPLPGKRLYHTSTVYTFKADYAAAGITLHAPVHITLDQGTETPLLREAVTPAGYVLYNDWVNRHSVAVSNQEGQRLLVSLLALAVASFVASAVIGLRQRFRPQR